MHASEIERNITGDHRLLRNLGPHDYLKPARGLVWCDECLQWNCHGLCDDEQVAGKIAARVEHCPCEGDGVIYCMGMADGEVAKLLQRYPSSRMKHAPPPVRRVYPVVVETEALCL